MLPTGSCDSSGDDLVSAEWPGGMHMRGEQPTGRPSPTQWGRGRHGQGCRFVLARPGSQWHALAKPQHWDRS